MGRRSERLSKQGTIARESGSEGDVIQVVSRAFDVLRCFEGHEARLGNLEISSRCGLPRFPQVTALPPQSVGSRQPVKAINDFFV